ncbi:MAG: anthranilate phosphoribosyltransferase [Deltaproteobacteria bacterium]|nr:MAG: anthranilate phosphoribosyltransferase [Deltaproteobacteria bacterium]
MTIPDAIARAVAGESLDEAEMATVMGRMMDGEATPAQIASLLTALRMKGETADELVGAARAMRARMTPLRVTTPVVDTCGTGGDGLSTFNVSTAAALIAAGAGVAVAKHGNRAMSGRVGGADVLEALGVTIDLSAAGVARCIAEAGIGFCFAPRFHAAMRFAAAPRREIGIRTMLNLLGPLANPAGADAQLVGVFAPGWTDVVAAALCRLGTRRALVVHGAEGLDEISATGPTKVSEVADGAVRTYHLEPRDFGVAAVAPAPRADDAAASAAIVRGVLAGDPGPARELALVNAAAVLVVAGNAADWRDGYEQAARAIASGTAAAALARLVAASGATA